MSDPTASSAKGVSWARTCNAISKRIEGFEAQSSQMLASVQEGKLLALRNGSLESFRAQSEAFKSARQKHETAQSNLTKESEKKNGGNKNKKATLQKELDATRKKQEETAKAAAAGATAAETEHMRTTRLCIRDIAFSQARCQTRTTRHAPRARPSANEERRRPSQLAPHAAISRVLWTSAAHAGPTPPLPAPPPRSWRCTRAGWRSSQRSCRRSRWPNRPRRRRDAPPGSRRVTARGDLQQRVGLHWRRSGAHRICWTRAATDPLDCRVVRVCDRYSGTLSLYGQAT